MQNRVLSRPEIVNICTIIDTFKFFKTFLKSAFTSHIYMLICACLISLHIALTNRIPYIDGYIMYVCGGKKLSAKVNRALLYIPKNKMVLKNVVFFSVSKPFNILFTADTIRKTVQIEHVFSLSIKTNTCYLWVKICEVYLY